MRKKNTDTGRTGMRVVPFGQLAKDDKIFYVLLYVLVTLLLAIIIYPLIYIISSSFSSPAAVASGQVTLLPVKPSLEGYQAVFKNKYVLTGYRNTIFYTALGTFINVAMTMIAAYPLSRPTLPGRKLFMYLFTFTMLFSGGMIPTYLLIRDLKMLDTIWALVIPGAISVYNMMIAKTFLQTSIPNDLYEAAQIDGCSHFRYFFNIVLPLSKAILAVLVLFYAVGHWNSYFNAFLYLQNKKLFPLQIILREILIANTIDTSLVVDPEVAAAKQGLAELLKYALIIVSTVPVMCLYPFVQKYFVKGVMIGSVKG